MIAQSVPAPGGSSDAPLQALIFDSCYDNYQGALSFVRIKNGSVQAAHPYSRAAGFPPADPPG